MFCRLIGLSLRKGRNVMPIAESRLQQLETLSMLSNQKQQISNSTTYGAPLERIRSTAIHKLAT